MISSPNGYIDIGWRFQMIKYALTLTALLIAAPALAAESSESIKQAAQIASLPIATLSARATRMVQNDTATASLFVEKEEADAAKASEAVTTQVNQAHAILKDFQELRVKTASHQAYPIWDKNRITRWRVRHELLMEAADFKTLSKAIGAVQPYAQLGGIQFSVSTKLQEATESQLIQEASAAFQRRADLVRQSFGAKAYRIKELAVQSNEPPHFAPMLRSQMAMATAEATPPTLEGGSNEISLSISGSIELTMP
jgi:predicted secreted protein